MEMVYNNFDGLDITFQGALPELILTQLKNAKEQAQNENRDIPLNLGGCLSNVMVCPTGVNAYRYKFTTNIDGGIWFASHSTNSSRWSIRVSMSSLSLALHGYEAVKQKIWDILDQLGAYGPSQKDEASGKIINKPIERISRFDYCFDFIMPYEFEPDLNHFVTHQRVKIREEGLYGLSETSGNKRETITLGKMPNRQIGAYNKTKEITVSSKDYWWDIWNLDQHSLKYQKEMIWRVEVRAGKKELDKWNARSFKAFEDKAGDIVIGILKAMRYTTPLKNDLNRSRWAMHPLWLSCIEAVLSGSLSAFQSGAIRQKIITGLKQAKISEFDKALIGNLISRAAIKGGNDFSVESALNDFREDFKHLDSALFKGIPHKIEKARDKYQFLT